MPSLPYWLFPGDDRPPEEIDDEVAEELQLHLDLMAEEQMRQGVPPDEARQKAAERFGDFDSYVRRCRVEKQGDIPMLKRVQAVLTTLLLVAVVWLGVRDYFTSVTTAEYMDQTTEYLTTIKDDLSKLQNGLQPPVSDESDEEVGVPVRIRVVHETGAPLPDAKLAIRWKDTSRSWVDTFAVPTDSSGRYNTRLTNPAHLIQQVTAYKEGYAFTSSNLLRPSFGDPGEPFVFRLPTSTKQRIQLLNEDQTPVSKTRVTPSHRVNSDGEYHQAITDLGIPGPSAKTDANGYITLDWFAPEDEASIRFVINGEERGAKFDVTALAGDTITVKVGPKQPNALGGGAF